MKGLLIKGLLLKGLLLKGLLLKGLLLKVLLLKGLLLKGLLHSRSIMTFLSLVRPKIGIEYQSYNVTYQLNQLNKNQISF